MKALSQVNVGRVMYWPPWSVTCWWVPRIWTGTDEWCRPSVCFTVPPLGCLIIFRGPRRTMPCADCWADMGEWQRADYLPDGYLEGGMRFEIPLEPGAHRDAQHDQAATGSRRRGRRAG